MERREIFAKLSKFKKEKLCDALSLFIFLCSDIDYIDNTEFGRGWLKSRESLVGFINDELGFKL